MLVLQREQFEHDERFHREISRLPIHARLNHMALHFCKYTGQLATLIRSKDDQLRAKTITDSFIISLCSANALNFDLSKAVAPILANSATLHDLGHYLVEKLSSDTELDDNWLLITHAREAAKMARACEKIDHLEEYPFRREIQDAVVLLCQTALMAAFVNDLDLEDAVHKRREEIRDRATFISEINA
jgi:hypothetical protein